MHQDLLERTEREDSQDQKVTAASKVTQEVKDPRESLATMELRVNPELRVTLAGTVAQACQEPWETRG